MENKKITPEQIETIAKELDGESLLFSYHDEKGNLGFFEVFVNSSNEFEYNLYSKENESFVLYDGGCYDSLIGIDKDIPIESRVQIDIQYIDEYDFDDNAFLIAYIILDENQSVNNFSYITFPHKLLVNTEVDEDTLLKMKVYEEIVENKVQKKNIYDCSPLLQYLVDLAVYSDSCCGYPTGKELLEAGFTQRDMDAAWTEIVQMGLEDVFEIYDIGDNVKEGDDVEMFIGAAVHEYFDFTPKKTSLDSKILSSLPPQENNPIEREGQDQILE